MVWARLLSQVITAINAAASRRGYPPHQQRYLALDGWRGICAIFVAILHFKALSHFSGLSLVRNAHLFVDFFFVLSGFVMTYAYQDRLRSLGDAGIMVWRRLGRLWPLHLALLAAFIALELAVPLIAMMSDTLSRSGAAFDPQSGMHLAAIPSHILLIHGLGIHDHLTWNIPSWSISVEFWVYIVFAIIVFLARRWTVWAAIALAAFGGTIIVLYSPEFLSTQVEFGFFRCLYGFFAGHLVYRLVKAAPARLPMPTLIEIAALVGVIAYISWCGQTSLELAAPLVLGVGVWIFAQEQGGVSTVLKSRPFHAVGAWSYSIYMVHSLVIAVTHRSLTALQQMTDLQLVADVRGPEGLARTITVGGPWFLDALTLVYVACVIGLAALTWRWIEMPAQKRWNGVFAAPVPAGVLPTTSGTTPPEAAKTGKDRHQGLEPVAT